jgi:NADH dehydrogenase (ubiquinone) 1 alpha subcomplex subunit 6
MALRVASEKLVGTNPAVTLYRHITKQVPRVLTLYDINMEPAEARLAVQAFFRQNATVKDPRVIDMLISKASMELEETLMQWKQKTHLVTMLDNGIKLKNQKEVVFDEYEEGLEQFFAGVDTITDEK